MSLTPKQKKSQPAWLDIAVFAAVLGFLCFSVQILLGFHQRNAVTKELRSIAATPPEDLTPKRAPASQSPVPKSSASTETLRLPCLQQASRTFSSEARLLQIHAPACNEDLKQSAGWKGSNESSGEEILVFVNSKEKSISTSYFSLKEGVNRIVLRHELGKGAAQIQTLEVKKEKSD